MHSRSKSYIVLTPLTRHCSSSIDSHLPRVIMPIPCTGDDRLDRRKNALSPSSQEWVNFSTRLPGWGRIAWVEGRARAHCDCHGHSRLLRTADRGYRRCKPWCLMDACHCATTTLTRLRIRARAHCDCHGHSRLLRTADRGYRRCKPWCLMDACHCATTTLTRLRIRARYWCRYAAPASATRTSRSPTDT